VHEEAVLRPMSGRIIAVVLVALALAIVIAGTIQLGPEAILPHLAVPVLIGYLGWYLFWAPCVRVSPGEVVLDNPATLTRIEWPQITMIDTKWALVVYTAHAKHTAWAASAPGRYSVIAQAKHELRHLPTDTYIQGTIRVGDIPTSDSGAAAITIRRQWEALRDAGHLEKARPEHAEPHVTVHWVRVAVLAALLVLAVAGLLS